MCIISEPVENIAGGNHGSHVKFRAPVRRTSIDGAVTITGEVIYVHPVDGVLTTPDLYPGAAQVILDGVTYDIVIPDAPTSRLAPLLTGGAPGVPSNAEIIGDAVDAYLEAQDLVEGDDPRLSDARTPTAHTHDDRYFTESEVTTALAGKQASGDYATNSAVTSALAGLTKSSVGLGNVDNTADAAKPISTAMQSALDAKQASLGFTAENVANRGVAGGYASLNGSGFVPTGQLSLTKANVGLSNVDNTSDTDKPVSSAQQTALNAKQPLDSDLTTIAGLTATTDNFMIAASSAWASRTPAQAKTALGLTKSDVGLGSVDNTSDAAKPVSTAVQTALDTKAAIGPVSTPLLAGKHYRPPTARTTGTGLMTADRMVGAVFTAGRSTNITSLSINVTTQGSAGSVIRLGIYSLGSNHVAGTLVADFGTVVGDSTGVKTATGTAAVVAGGLYVAVAVGQGSPGTQPIVTVCAQHDPMLGSTSSSTIYSSTLAGLQVSSITGALTASPTFIESGGAMPLVTVMAAA